MKVKNYSDMMMYLTRPDIMPEDLEIMNLADGGRIGFEKGGIPKGYINLSQLGEKVGLPERIVTNPETGRKRSLGGLRQRIIDTLTRTPSAERGNLKTKDFINNVLVKELDLKKIDLGQGQPTYIIKDPKVKQLDTLKEYFLRKGSKYGITQETVVNMKKFYNDPTLRKYIRKGEFIPDNILEARGIGKNQAANVTFRLAQHLNGKKFANVNVDLPVNKSLAKKIFKQIEKAPFGNPYQLTAYKEAQNIITNELGSEYFDRTNLESMKREARKILNREGVPTFDPTVKGTSGFNVNEIIGIKTGARVKGLAPYSQFINIMEGKLNTAQYANFVRQFEKFNNRMQTENKSDVIKDYNKYRKTFLKNNPNVKDVDVPKFSLQSPEKIYGKNRINELAKEGLDINKSYDDIGYTVDVGKKTRTLKEFITDPKKIARLKKFGKVGTAVAAAAALPSVVAASPLSAEEAVAAEGAPAPLSLTPIDTPVAAGTGAAAVGTKTGRSLLGKAFRAVGTPFAGATLAGTQIASNINKGENIADAVIDPIVGLELSFPGLFRENISKITSNPRVQQLLTLGRFGRALTPVGLGITAAGAGVDLAKFTKDRINQLRSMSPEDRQKLQEQSDAFAFNEFSAAGGGIAKLAGKRSGPAPESGPTPQGLDFLMKRVR